MPLPINAALDVSGMTVNDLQPLLTELFAIKWLLIVVAALLLIIILVTVAFSVNALALLKGFRTEYLLHAEEKRIEHLLARGAPRDAKYAAEEWLAYVPSHPPALLLLAKAHYHLGELSNCRATLARILELAPDLDVVVHPWMQVVSERLKEKPRAVE